ncbi:phosphate-starvation-inducible PsiE family protein [Catellatospora vulcania]|uniref:phosphate-starvation-inducible PsiE family protein n=1 Tax=Catellatospora vulcania TaxID=1460450 RepID=UPI0012D43345|nr:phosphate-starvation-inducible PsiE family protein [Catellatospora vulcania]
MSEAGDNHPVADKADAPDQSSPSKLAKTLVDTGDAERADNPALRLLSRIEWVLLYGTALVLLLVGAVVLVLTVAEALRGDLAVTERLLLVIEELLLVLIIMEIFVTVLASLRGARFMLEPFLLVAVIAVVRHILSLVVRLSAVHTEAEVRIRLVELAVDAGVVLALVGALVLNRWSTRRHSDD